MTLWKVEEDEYKYEYKTRCHTDNLDPEVWAIKLVRGMYLEQSHRIPISLINALLNPMSNVQPSASSSNRYMSTKDRIYQIWSPQEQFEECSSTLLA